MSALYLIDVSALAYRSFYAFIKNPLKNSKGQETSAIFGFASHILRLIKDCEPSHIAFVKDLPKPTFRHEMYEDYKAHRKPMPDGLREQLPIIDQFVELSGLKTVSLEGYEADDVMATLAVQAKSMGMKVYIVTRDKDMMQLVDDSIFLFELGKNGEQNLITGAKEVKEKMGVPPEKIIDYLSLIGDSADNVPGVAKVGPKGACDLLDTYGTLENIYKNVESITKKALKENLIAGRESAFLSKKLVILDKELKLPITVDDLRYSAVNAPALSLFLEEWELKSLLRFVPGAPKPSRAAKVAVAAAAMAVDAVAESVALVEEAVEALAGPEPEYNERYELINNKPALEELGEKLAASPVIAVDTETTGLDNMTADLVGICLSVEAGAGYYIPVGHKVGTNVDLDKIQKVLKPVLDDPNKRLLFHNGKYDLPILRRHGLLPSDLDRNGKLVDTMVAAYLANPGERHLSLDDLSLRHFAHQMIPIEKLIGKGKNQKNFSDVPILDACQYGAEDADITFRLWDIYGKELEEKDLTRLFFDMEMALMPVLMAMEGRGITLDTEALGRLSAQLKEEIVRLEKEIHALAGEEFNIGSPTQLQVILFEKLRLKPGKKTKTGYSTDADVLAKLEGDHPIVGKLLDYRESTKLQNTYVEALPTMVHEATKRVHTSYSQVIAATGRLSSIDPNLQNIPVRTELGKEVRRCFTSSAPGRVLLCADYSQIELRLLAHLSGDPSLKDAYRNNIDIHTRTAALIYKIPESEVTSDMRRSAKVVNFGVLYGMGASRLSSQLRIPRGEASKFIENYFSSYALVDAYIRGTVEKGRKQGYVETLAGRRRYLPDLLSDNPMHRENAERIAANTPIQGSAADLIKLAMIRIHKRLEADPFGCDMLLQVHDELVFEVAEKDVPRASALIKAEMEGAMQLDVPLVVEIGTGTNWLEAHA